MLERMAKRPPYRMMATRDGDAIRGLVDVRLGEAVSTPSGSTVRLADGYCLARLDARVLVNGLRVHSTSNDNTTFIARVGLECDAADGRRVAPDAYVYLGVDDRWWSGVVCGAGSEGGAIASVCNFDRYGYFQLDRAGALALAHVCGVEAHERAPLDACITYAWGPIAMVERGCPIPLSLRIRNAGRSPVMLTRSIAAISCEALYDGRPVAAERGVMNAPYLVDPIAPGDEILVTADLRAAISLERAGTYTVTARFAGRLEPSDVPAGEAFMRAATWDVDSTWHGTIIVS